MKDAHAAGLAVHPWTVRIEAPFLPKTLQRADGAETLLKAIYASGVDGVFSDFPGLAVKVRDAA